MNTPDNQSTHVPRAAFRVAVADAGRLERELIRVKDELEDTKAELQRTKDAIVRVWGELDEVQDRVDAATEATRNGSLDAVVDALKEDHWPIVHLDKFLQRVRELRWSEWKEWDKEWKEWDEA